MAQPRLVASRPSVHSRGIGYCLMSRGAHRVGAKLRPDAGPSGPFLTVKVTCPPLLTSAWVPCERAYLRGIAPDAAPDGDHRPEGGPARGQREDAAARLAASPLADRGVG